MRTIRGQSEAEAEEAGCNARYVLELANDDCVSVLPSTDSRGKVFLVVVAQRGKTRMTPAEAREVARMLMNAAHKAEKEAGK